MIQFYAPDIETTGCLSPEDATHCSRVLRKNAGDHIWVTDGKGTRFDCEITLSTPRKVEVEIARREEVARNWSGEKVVCVAPTKNMDRMEWLVEKAVETGVDRIIPVICDRSERRQIKRERLEKIAVSAMKQSLKTHLPEIGEAVTFRELLDQDFGGLTVMGYCDDNTERRSFASLYRPNEPVRILIGPEGDFSPGEVRQALEKGIQPVTFGRERLRTETAALAALHTTHVVDELG